MNIYVKALIVAAALGAVVFLNNRYVVEPAVAKNDKAWSDKWHARDLADDAAKTKYDTDQRTKEQAAQAAADALAADQAKRDAKAARDLAAAKRESGRLREGVAAAIAQLQQQRGENPGAIPYSSTGKRAGVLLTQLFGEINQRSTDLAGEADRARTAGLNCEKQYDAVMKILNEKDDVNDAD